MLLARNTLLIPSGPSHDPSRRHLHIVCTDTNDHGMNLLIPLSTWTNDYCDPTCILRPYDHSWLVKPKSYVFYRNADFFKASKLQQAIRNKQIAILDSCNPQVFLRIKNGICQSLQTPKKVKRYFGC